MREAKQRGDVVCVSQIICIDHPAHEQTLGDAKDGTCRDTAPVRIDIIISHVYSYRHEQRSTCF